VPLRYGRAGRRRLAGSALLVLRRHCRLVFEESMCMEVRGEVGSGLSGLLGVSRLVVATPADAFVQG